MKKFNFLRIVFCSAVLALTGLVAAPKEANKVNAYVNEKIEMTADSYAAGVWNSSTLEGDGTFFKYYLGYGTLSNGSTGYAYHTMTKDSSSVGFTGTDCFIDWGGAKLNSVNNGRIQYKVRAVKPVKIEISADAAPSGWMDNGNDVQLKYYVISNSDVVNATYYEPAKTVNMVSGTTTAADLAYTVSLEANDTFVLEWGFPYTGESRNWQNLESLTFSFTQLAFSETYPMSSMISAVAANNGNDITTGTFANYNIYHGDIANGTVAKFDSYSENLLKTSDNNAYVENWSVKSKENENIIFQFTAKKYSTLVISREALGDEWLDATKITVKYNDNNAVLVKELTNSTTAADFNYQIDLRVGDVFTWQWGFEYKGNYRGLAMLNGGDIVKTMPKFTFVEIEHNTHTWTKVAGTPAGCESTGLKDYYTCDCGLIAEDSEGTTLISDLETWKANDGKIAANGHKGEKVTGQDAGCITAGYKDAYKCSECGNYYTDSACTSLIGDEAAYEAWKSAAGKINSKGHTGVKVSGLAAGCETDGYKDAWKCSACNEYFANEACTSKIGDEAAYNAWKVAGGKIAATGHNGVKVEGKAATCEEVGYKDAWKCSVDGKYFSDEACTVLIGDQADYEAWILAAGKIAATGHTGVKVEGKAATCEEVGYKDAWKCNADNKYFSDEACTVLIGDEAAYNAWKVGEGKIAAKGHTTYVFVEEVAATKKESGVKAHYVCEDCNKLFVKDGDSYVEVAADDLVIAKEKSNAGIVIAAIVAAGVAVVAGVGIIFIRRKKKN